MPMPSPSRRALFAAALPCLMPLRAALAFELVSREEVAASAAGPTPPLTRSVIIGGPNIEVDSPGGSLSSGQPVAFRLRFVPADGAPIDPASFRAYYGSFGIDITGRIQPRARISAQGLVAEDVTVPAGQHRVLLTIADTQGRVGRREVRFSVA
ncbi:hypothetical protein [Plastoroseomonas arctica]|uniref:Uncharacterized protein n=1 Tax=Plastoroseomonas arctica TaxID=1509237 RepID=A0AAF1K4Y6_9PROT|nr:hypothetical protein [Plastoroseomonas arctica]MBR0655820.1 hypothetical protein [Plastoroseomonas arctica]